jgi:hypothetical protein
MSGKILKRLFREILTFSNVYVYWATVINNWGYNHKSRKFICQYGSKFKFKQLIFNLIDKWLDMIYGYYFY